MPMHVLNDFRQAARRLLASPGFAFAAIATIAIGIGINTGIFSVLNALAFRDLPVRESSEIVGLGQAVEGVERRVYGAPIMFSTAEYRAYRDSSTTLSGLLGYSMLRYVTLGGAAPRQIAGTLVTCNYFEVLREPLALGAGFRSDDCETQAVAPAVVLGHDLWTSVFGADPAVVGREIVVNRRNFTVVGVAAEGMRGFDLQAAEYFAPISVQPILDERADWLHDDQASWLTLIGRLAPGATLEQVKAELDVIAARIDQAQPPRATTLLVESGRPPARPGARELFVAASVVVMTAFGMVLLIACANVANLLLARATDRAGEIAVRLSLGATRGRIVQHLLAESLLIAALGGAVGYVLAFWSFQGLVTFATSAVPADAPRVNLNVSPDTRVLAYSFLLTVGAGVLFGLVPALHASKRDLHSAMKGTSTVGRRSDGKLRGALVGAQVAICMVLMIGASLLLRGLLAAQTVEPGFRYENVAVASFDFGSYDEARAAAFHRQLMARVGALPGVEAVAQTQRPPLAEGTTGGLAGLPGQEQLMPTEVSSVSSDYFTLLEMPVVRGRAFTAADETGGSTAAIVPEAMARRLWPARDPIGQKLVVEHQGRIEVEIVGVVRDAQVTTIGNSTPNYVYLPAAPRTQRGQQLLVKSRGDEAATAAAIRAAVAELDPDMLVQITPLEANLDFWRSISRVISVLSAGLGVVALVLAGVGVYGVVAYAVSRRLREIGIRMALGADVRDVVALVLKCTMRPVVVGGAIGLVLALAASRVLSGVLFGVSPVDPVALFAALVVVGGGALAAGWLPARRASRVEPNTVLHSE